MPPGHRLADRRSIPLRDMAGEPVVIERADHGLRDLVDQCCRQAGFAPRIGYEIDEPAAIFGFVKANLGVAFAPAAVRDQIDQHGLRALHLTDPACRCTFGIAWHRERYLSGAARAFRRFVLASFGGAEPQPAPPTAPPLARTGRHARGGGNGREAPRTTP